MILPLRRQTVVSPDKADEVLERLRHATGIKHSDIAKNKKMRFMGRVGSDSFQITRRLDRPENFIPQINGKIEESSTGCILFLRYTLQFSSKMFVVFWSVTGFMFALFLWFLQSDIKLGLVALGALILNVIITHINFQRQYEKSRKVLLEILQGAGN